MTALTVNHEYEPLTETAKRARKELKAEFPGVKFSVRCEKFAGGDAIRIGWTDGPAEGKVREFASQYRGYHADETGDFMDPNSPDLIAEPDGTYTLLHAGAMFVDCTRDLSEAAQAKAIEVVEAFTGEPFDGRKLYQYETVVDGTVAVMVEGGETFGWTLVHQLCALAAMEVK